MIIREWRARARQAEAARYPEYFRRQLTPELRIVPGFLGATLSQRPSGEYVEFLVLTRWTSMDAIRGFAGSASDNAVIDTGAMATVETYDDKVRHYEVLEDIVSKDSSAAHP
jgi:heme-degrading monooxygenase HmoA